MVTGSGPRQLNRPGTWGEDGVRERTSSSTWAKPKRWNRLAADGVLPVGDPNPDGHRPRVFCASLADVFEPRPELEPWRAELFALIEATPNLDWLVLTKRPEVARDWLMAYYADHGARGVRSTNAGQLDLGTGQIVVPDVVEWETFGRAWTTRDGLGWGCLPNLWVGTSIENSRHTWRADVLREIPAAVRFISAEPLLGSLFEIHRGSGSPLADSPGEVAPRAPRQGRPDEQDRPTAGTPGRASVQPEGEDDGTTGVTPNAGAETDRPESVEREGHGAARGRAPLDLTGIDWAIVGGESGGRDARPMSPAWAREIRDAVLAVSLDAIGLPIIDPENLPPGVMLYGEPLEIPEGMMPPRPAFHFKQWGSYAPRGFVSGKSDVDERHEKWVGSGVPGDERWRMFYYGIGPKSGGKLLDGVEWCEFPTGAGALTPA